MSTPATEPAVSGTAAPAAQPPSAAPETVSADSPGPTSPPRPATPPKAATDDPRGGDARVSATGDLVSLKDSTAGDINLHRTIARGDYNNVKKVFIGTDGRATVSAFSMRMADPIPAEFEKDNATQHCLDDGVLHSLLAVLKETRLLVLTAEPDSGKGATALALAHALKERQADAPAATWRVLPLDADIRIDVAAVIKKRKQFSGGVLLFKDALARGNRDLLALLSSLDGARLAELRSQLAASASYLVFTADLETLGHLEPPLAAHGVCLRVPPLSEAKRGEGLRRVLTSFDPKLALTESQLGEIVAYARSMPKIRRLLQNYLPQIHAGTMQVREACDRLADVTSRFHGELTDDFDAWTLAFVLTLALAVNPDEGITWTEFEELRRLLLPSINACVRGTRPVRDSTRESFSDKALLRKALAIVERDPGTGRDMLKFQNAEDARLVWNSLLDNNRSVLNEIFPVMRGCMDHSIAASPGIRVRCAQIIGRLGEMDPSLFTVATLHHCANQKHLAIRASSAYIIEGVCASNDAHYRERCIRALEDMASANSHGEAGLSDDERERRWNDDRILIWSAVAACKRLGRSDLRRAMSLLRGVAERNLATPMTAARDMERLLQEIDSKLGNKGPSEQGQAAQLAFAAELVRELSSDLLAKQAQLLFATQYTIVALCITVDPVDVLRHLRSWLTGSSGLRIVTALIYLQSGGIAESLNECEVPVDERDDEDAAAIGVNPLVSALIRDPSQAEVVAAFLQDIFVCFRNQLPSKVVPRLLDLFIGYLTSMARQAAKSPIALRAIEDLFSHLLASRITDLKTRVLEPLRVEDDFRQQGTPLAQFARNVRKRALGEA